MKIMTQKMRTFRKCITIAIVWLAMGWQFVFADLFINPWGQKVTEHVISPTTWQFNVNGRESPELFDYHMIGVPIHIDREITELSFQAKTVGIDLDVVVGELKFGENGLVDGVYNVWAGPESNFGLYIGFTGDNGLIRSDNNKPLFVLEVRNGVLFLVTDDNSSNAAVSVAPHNFDPNTPSDFRFGVRRLGFGFNQCINSYPFDTDGSIAQYQITDTKRKRLILTNSFIIAKDRSNLDLGLEQYDSCLKDHIDHFYLKFLTDVSSDGAILKIVLNKFGKTVNDFERKIYIGEVEENDDINDTLSGITLESLVNYTASEELLESLNNLRLLMEDDDGDGIVQLPIWIREFEVASPYQVFQGGIKISNVKVEPPIRSIYKKGDLNEDGCVDRIDLRILVEVIKGIRPPNPSINYNINDDTQINILDARALVTKPYFGVSCNPF